MSALTGKEDAFAVPLLKLRTLACKKNATPKLDPPRQVRCHPICYQRQRSRKEQYEYEWLFLFLFSRPQEWCYDSYPLSFVLEPDTHVGFSVKGILVIRCPYKIMHSSFTSKTYWKLMRLQCNLIHVTKTYNLRTQQHLHLRSPTFGGSCVEHEKICADVDQPTLLETFQGDRI